MSRYKIFLSVCMSCVFFLLGCSSESALYFQCNGQVSPLIALNRNARSARVVNPESSGYMYFAFSADQCLMLAQSAVEQGVISVEITVSLLTADDTGQFAYGFLYSDDFVKEYKLKKDLPGRPMIQGKFSSSVPSFRLAATVPSRNLADIRGIVVYATVPAEVSSVKVVPAAIGYDISPAIPRFCFGSNGGAVSFETPGSAADFTGAEAVFGEPDRKEMYRPVIRILLSDNVIQPEHPSNQIRMELDVGGESVYIRRVPGQKVVTLQCAGLQNPYGTVVPVEHQEQLTGVLMEYVKVDSGIDGFVLDPLATDPGLIPGWASSSWRTRDYELFEWEQFPGLLIFDTADYAVQDDFFKRLAFFTEKSGYIGTLAPDREIAWQHGFNAHDYRAETLASFFHLALETNFPLNQKEQLLCRILVHNGIIVPVEQNGVVTGYKPGYGGLISISQESLLYLRHTLLTHECLHGLYFIDSGFRDYVAQVFQTADAESIRFLLRYFQVQSSLNYNLEDTYLIQNEFMAYVMQQSVARTAAYFADNLAWRGSMLEAEPELCAYIQATKGEGFRDASAQLSSYVFSRWGLESGRVALVTR